MTNSAFQGGEQILSTIRLQPRTLKGEWLKPELCLIFALRLDEFQINNRHYKPARFFSNLAGLSVSTMLNNGGQLIKIHKGGVSH